MPLIEKETDCHICGKKMKFGERFSFIRLRSQGKLLNRWPVHAFHIPKDKGDADDGG